MRDKMLRPFEEVYKRRPMEVCEICGAMLFIDDAPQRLDDHIQGKQHVGYARIRAYIAERQKKKEEVCTRCSSLLFSVALWLAVGSSHCGKLMRHARPVIGSHVFFFYRRCHCSVQSGNVDVSGELIIWYEKFRLKTKSHWKIRQ